jgi:hypothetical protein
MTSPVISNKNNKPYPLFFVPSRFLKVFLFIYLFAFFATISNAQLLPGFMHTGSIEEQELNIKDQWKNVIVNICAPLQFNRKGKTHLIFFALNGQKGKSLKQAMTGISIYNILLHKPGI